MENSDVVPNHITSGVRGEFQGAVRSVGLEFVNSQKSLLEIGWTPL